MAQLVKKSACNAGHPCLILGLGRFPGEGNGNPPQYSCLENPMDRGAWRATVHRVAESDATEWLIIETGANSNVHQGMDKQNVIYPYSGISFSTKEESAADTCYNMTESQKYYVTWKKSDAKDYTFYYFVYMKCQRKQILGKENRSGAPGLGGKSGGWLKMAGGNFRGR